MPPFERSVFVNCPFDDDFAPLLQAIAFCVTDLDFFPRFAPENADNSASRLDRIVELVRSSKFGIHDLSRCRSTKLGGYARMNMPFELGLDHGAKRFGSGSPQQKSILVLEHTRYDYQKSLSDIAGWDIQAHGGDFLVVIRKVRDWLVQHAGAAPTGASRIQDHYYSFQAWRWERELATGASEDDIKAYPTDHVVAAMQQWVSAGRPVPGVVKD